MLNEYRLSTRVNHYIYQYNFYIINVKSQFTLTSQILFLERVIVNNETVE